MENIYNLVASKEIIKRGIFDLFMVAAIYLLPAISHLITFPLYMFEPMRILIILSIVYTSKRNAFILAVTLPLFSFAVASHPYFLKAAIMCVELSVNIFLFYLLKDKFKNLFVPLFLSILLAKMVYYSLKITLISTGLIASGIISTPVYIQLLLAIVLSIFVQFTMTGNNNKKAAV